VVLFFCFLKKIRVCNAAVGGFMKLFKLILLSLFLVTSFFTQAAAIEVMFSPQQGEQAFDRIKSDIASAKSSVKLTVYSWTDYSVKDAIFTALNNGAEVRVVLHPSLARKSSFKKHIVELEAAGAEVKVAKMNMHEKFYLIDDKILMNSSANLSTSAKTRYSENFIFHDDSTQENKELMAQFIDEFAILWNTAKDITTHDEENAKPLEVIDFLNKPAKGSSTLLSSSMNFSLKENKESSSAYKNGQYLAMRRILAKKDQIWTVRDRILYHINNAQKSIYLSLNHMNIREVSDALIEAVKRGVDVKLAVDNQEFKTRPNGKEMAPQFVADWKKLQGNKNKTAPVRVKYYSHAPSPMYWLLNHHKFILVDYDETEIEKTVLISGSYNLSRTAEHKQFDNMVIYQGADKATVFAAFKGEFDNLWGLNRNEQDLPAEEVISKFTNTYKDSLNIHSNEAISLTFSEIKKLRSKIVKISPLFFKGLYKNRNCKFFSLVDNEFWACPSH
jgi:phosphatidylserine/phosphatidylglycerophosphate/cardiolipin synthase-like enzyme